MKSERVWALVSALLAITLGISLFAYSRNLELLKHDELLLNHAGVQLTGAVTALTVCQATLKTAVAKR